MRLRLALAAAYLSLASAFDVGSKIPPGSTLDFGFPPTKIDLAERMAGKKVILLGLPGAFTPTWSTRQVPGYLEEVDALKKLGISEVIVYCVNDGAVMDAWAKDQGVDQSDKGLVTMMGDPSGALTASLGMTLSHPGPMAVLGYPRCKRFAMYLEDGVVKVLRVSEADDDPAGDDRPEATLAPAMIKAIKEIDPILKSEL